MYTVRHLPAGAERLIGTTSRRSLQDLLRLLTLWFNYGAAPDVEAALQEGFSHVSIDTWLAVIPQVSRRLPELSRW